MTDLTAVLEVLSPLLVALVLLERLSNPKRQKTESPPRRSVFRRNPPSGG